MKLNSVSKENENILENLQEETQTEEITEKTVWAYSSIEKPMYSALLGNLLLLRLNGADWLLTTLQPSNKTAFTEEVPKSNPIENFFSIIFQ